MHRLLYVLLLAGCPPPPRYAVVTIHDPSPVANALVAAECGAYSAATQTDDAGYARLALPYDAPDDRCTLTVAKPGYRTGRTNIVQLCTNATACPPIVIDFIAAYSFAMPRTFRARPSERTYAQPPPPVVAR